MFANPVMLKMVQAFQDDLQDLSFTFRLRDSEERRSLQTTIKGLLNEKDDLEQKLDEMNSNLTKVISFDYIFFSHSSSPPGFYPIPGSQDNKSVCGFLSLLQHCHIYRKLIYFCLALSLKGKGLKS